MNAPAAPNFSKLLKNPAVIIGGIVLALILVYVFTRSGTSVDSGAATTLQSQATASSTDVALSSAAYDYGKAALQYNAALAQIAVDSHTADLSANTSIVAQTLANLDNLTTHEAQLQLNSDNVAGSIALNAQNNSAMLEQAKIQAATTTTLAPLAASTSLAMASIGASTALDTARINAGTATQLAQISAASKATANNTQLVGNTTHDIISNLPALMDLLP